MLQTLQQGSDPPGQVQAWLWSMLSSANGSTASRLTPVELTSCLQRDSETEAHFCGIVQCALGQPKDKFESGFISKMLTPSDDEHATCSADLYRQHPTAV